MKLLTVFILQLFLITNTFAKEIVVYDNMPITIKLNVGQERSIDFGDHVMVGLTKGQKIKNQFRVQSAQGVLHLKPKEEFQKQRVQVKKISNGKVYLIDIFANKSDQSLENIEVVDKDIEADKVQQESVSRNITNTITPITLVRSAAQKLYGPTRLHKDYPGITTSVLNVKPIRNLFRNSNRNKVLARPIMLDKGGKYKQLAIQLLNISNEYITLDYLDINVPFTHAVFQHHALNQAGMPGDTTILYLISDGSVDNMMYSLDFYQMNQPKLTIKSRNSFNDYGDFE